MNKTLVITNMPTPYRLSFWDNFHDLEPQALVLFCAEREPNRIWKLDYSKYNFPHAFLKGTQIYLHSLDTSIQFNVSIIKYLFDKDVNAIVLTGYSNPTYLISLIVAKFRRLPVTLWWGSHKLSGRLNSGLIGRVKRIILKSFDSYLTYGTMSTQFLLELDIPRNSIFEGINSVDVKLYSELASKQKPIPRKSVDYLFVGQFIDRKGIDELINAFQIFISNTGYDVKLKLVGYGHKRQEIIDKVLSMGLEDRIIVLDPTNTPEQIVFHYVNSDILVMPSIIEVWGLVVNEALATGMYCLTSKTAGATPDLILSAPNDVGLSFDPKIQEDFINALKASYKKIKDGFNRQDSIDWIGGFTQKGYSHQLSMAIHKAKSKKSREYL